MEVIKRRTQYLLNDTLMLAAAALDPEALYRSKFAQHQSAQLATTLALKKLASSPMEASAAIDQFVMFFSPQKGLFGSPEARCSALRGNMSAAEWWTQYGGKCKELQRLAKHIVSQCVSSSGCERNWSTFALVHTKLRNRIGYEKLHKLVYIHYNLKLYIQQFEADFQNSQEKDADPCSIMMDVALYDEANPIIEWISHSMSGSTPTLDEYNDDDDDWTAPGSFFIEELQMEVEEVAAFKRKLCFGKKGSKKRKAGSDEEGFLDDNGSDSSSDGDGVGGGDGGGVCVGVGSGGSGSNGGAGVVGEPSSLRARSIRKKRTPSILKSVYEL